MSHEIIRTDDFVKSASERIICIVKSVLEEKSWFVLGLCGGGTPFPVYSRIAAGGADIPWDKIIITFGDERCVPPEHEQSNFRAAKEKFFDLIPIPEANVLRIKGEESPEKAASDYEDQLNTVAARLKVKSFRHDLILLGMGDDGHTASLFPGTDALRVREGRVVANYVPKLGKHRITLTLPFINASDRVMFLVNDKKKQPLCEDVIAGRGDYPAGMIKPHSGNLSWILGGVM